MNNMYSKTGRIVGLGILTALVIILQTFAGSFKIGAFSPPLSLIPIIIGAILFGKAGGALLGSVFGAVVVAAVVTGAEPFSTLMFNYRPATTLLICVFKGAGAGYFSAVMYNFLAAKNNSLAVVVASVTAPFVNTGIFSAGMLTVFYELLTEAALEAGSSNPVLFYFTAFLGVNFILELIFVSVLVPVIIRIIKIVKKQS